MLVFFIHAFSPTRLKRLRRRRDGIYPGGRHGSVEAEQHSRARVVNTWRMKYARRPSAVLYYNLVCVFVALAE